MDIQIRELEHFEQARSIEMDSSFTIDSILNLRHAGPHVRNAKKQYQGMQILRKLRFCDRRI